VPTALEPLEETLVADVRAGLTPSEMVARKLIHLLHGGSVLDSHVRTGGPLARDRARAHCAGPGQGNEIVVRLSALGSWTWLTLGPARHALVCRTAYLSTRKLVNNHVGNGHI
jgi:hypothetical protein